MGRRATAADEEEEEEEDASECSSGCQSGWTMYLDQSHDNLSSTPLAYRKGGSEEEEEEGEEEEDLSMISDASSGPPLFHEDAALAESGGKRRRLDAHEQQQQQQQPHPKEPSFLDDTASSPPFPFPRASFNARAPSEEHVLEFSSCFSATHFKKNPALEKHMGGYMQSSSHVKPTTGRPPGI